MRLVTFYLAYFASLAAASRLVAPPPPRMEAYAAAYVHRLVTQFRGNDLGSAAVRDLAAAAWALLSLSDPSDANVTLAGDMITLVFTRQLRDGSFPWTFDNKTFDNNSVQFTALPILRSVAHFGSRFGAATLALWAPNISLAAVASFAEGDGPHTEAQPYYTNIATMRLVNLHLFAQLTGNATLRAQADAATMAWSALVDSAGLHEYASPTYTAVALANLIAGAASVTDAAVASTLRRYARFVFAYTAAHYFAPAREMAGPHSRDYDFLFGSAGMDWGCGVADGDSFVLDQDPITMTELLVCYVRGDVAALALPAALLALAAPPGAGAWRVARYSYLSTAGNASATAGADVYMYTSPVASLGTASLYYGPQDKMVVAQLAVSPAGAPPATSPRLAQVTLVQDAFDAPYGMVKSADSSGHEKPTHLKPTVATVQDGGLALVLNDLTMAIENSSHLGPFDSLATNVVFPAGRGVDAVYTLTHGRLANVSAGAPDVALKLDEVVAVRSAGGVVAFRVPFVDGLSGFEPSAALRFDGPRGSDAARLVTYLYRGPNVTFPNRPPPSRSVLVLAVGAASSDDEALAFAARVAALAVANEAQNASNWRVSVAPPAPASGDAPPPGFSSTLSASLWVPDRKLILTRRVNGSDVRLPPGGVLELRGDVHLDLTTETFA